MFLIKVDEKNLTAAANKNVCDPFQKMELYFQCRYFKVTFDPALTKKHKLNVNVSFSMMNWKETLIYISITDVLLFWVT